MTMEMLKADTQALLRLVKHNEEAEYFNLNTWIVDDPDKIETCGTYGCLVGNDLLRVHPRRELNKGALTLILRGELYDQFYRCPPVLFNFLFAAENSPTYLRRWIEKREAKGFTVNESLKLAAECRPGCDCLRHMSYEVSDVIDRDPEDKEAAIARVRKAIYYILRKRELLYDENGEFSQEKYEAARKTGHADISNKVLEEVACV